MSLILGIIGAIVLAIAWIPETLQIIRERESKLNPKFAVVYFVGTLLLFIYALSIKDIVFIIVNSVILTQVCISLYVEFIIEPKMKKRRRK